MFLRLPFTWLSLRLAGFAVSDFGLSLLQACVLVLLGDQFFLGEIWVWRAVVQGQLCAHRCVGTPGRPALSWRYVCSSVAQDQLWAQTETGRLLSQAAPWFLCPQGSGRVSLSSMGDPTYNHRPVCTPWRLFPSQCYWVWSPVAEDLL